MAVDVNVRMLEVFAENAIPTGLQLELSNDTNWMSNHRHYYEAAATSDGRLSAVSLLTHDKKMRESI